MMRIPVQQTVFHCRHGHRPARGKCCSRIAITAVSTFSATALSDSGNIYATTSGSLPPSPTSSGRFSNGPTYAEDLQAATELCAAPSLLGGTNYAFGGAHCRRRGDDGDPVARRSGLDVPRETRRGRQRAVCRLGRAATIRRRPGGHRFGVGRHSGAIQGLYQGGARNFLVMNLPNLGLTPEARG